MNLKVENKCRWKDIKTKEVFVMNDFNDEECFNIFCKINTKEAILLDTDFSFNWNGQIYKRTFFDWDLYKLSLLNQRLWKEI